MLAVTIICLALVANAKGKLGPIAHDSNGSDYNDSNGSYDDFSGDTVSHMSVQVSHISPRSGPWRGDTVVSIRGHGFLDASNSSTNFFVDFQVLGETGKTRLPVTVKSNREIVFKTPRRDAWLDPYQQFKVASITLRSLQPDLIKMKEPEPFRLFRVPIIKKMEPQKFLLGKTVNVQFRGENLFAAENVKCLFRGKRRKATKNCWFDVIDQIPVLVCPTPSWLEPEPLKLSFSYNGQQYHSASKLRLYAQPNPSLVGGNGYLVGGVTDKSDGAGGGGGGAEGFDNGGGVNGTVEELVDDDTPLRTTKIMSVQPQPQTATNQLVHAIRLVWSSKKDESGPSSPSIDDPQYKGSSKVYEQILKDDEENLFSLTAPGDLRDLKADPEIGSDLFKLCLGAVLGGIVAIQLRLPAVVGFVLAGVFISNGAGHLYRVVPIFSLAQLGAGFMLLKAGMEVNFKRAFANPRALILCGWMPLVILPVAMGIAAELQKTPISEGIVIGWLLAFASTAIWASTTINQSLPSSSSSSLSALSTSSSPAHKNNHNFSSELVTLVLVCQDLGIGFVLSYLPILEEFGNNSGISWISLTIVHPFFVVIQALGLFVCLGVLGFLGLPLLWLLISRTKSRELLFLACFAIFFGLSKLAESFGYSWELGSFCSGVFISVTMPEKVLRDIKPQMDPVVSLFSAMYFCSVGLLMDWGFLFENFTRVFILWFICSVIKFFTMASLMFFSGSTTISCISGAICLSNLSEFGFMFIHKAKALNVISENTHALCLAVTTLSLLVSAPMVAWASKLTAKTFISPPDFLDIDHESPNLPVAMTPPKQSRTLVEMGRLKLLKWQAALDLLVQQQLSDSFN